MSANCISTFSISTFLNVGKSTSAKWHSAKCIRQNDIRQIAFRQFVRTPFWQVRPQSPPPPLPHSHVRSWLRGRRASGIARPCTVRASYELPPYRRLGSDEARGITTHVLHSCQFSDLECEGLGPRKSDLFAMRYLPLANGGFASKSLWSLRIVQAINIMTKELWKFASIFWDTCV